MGPERMHPRLKLMLTFTTGMIDEIGKLGLDRVLTRNRSEFLERRGLDDEPR